MPNKKLILSIDGGGVAGLIPVYFLAELEKDLNKNLYDTFDVFAGTSIGALIVLAISGLQYNSEQLLDLVNEENLKQIFNKHFFSFLSLISGPKYSGKSKRALLDTIFGDKKFLSIEKQTLVTAYNIINNQAVIFKSQGGTDADYNPTIAEVADASSAAPTYFPSVTTSQAPRRWLIDGGIAADNPSMCIVSTMIHSGCDLKDLKVLSLGTGVCNRFTSDPEKYGLASKSWGGIGWLRHQIINDLLRGDVSTMKYAVNELLKENHFRVDGLLDSVQDEIDNITPSNIAALEKLGQTWYQKNREKLLAWIKG